MNHYTDDNHAQLANFLQQEAGFRWVLSYDDVPQIRGLYTTQNLYRFPLKYTVEMKRTGYELLTHSLNLRFPQNMQIKRNKGKAIDIERIK
jgi:DNA adenine methylase